MLENVKIKDKSEFSCSYLCESFCSQINDPINAQFDNQQRSLGKATAEA